mmetsp:Transcript_74104/g.229053  ORF Transcript_74104/g.229053 Transcript_74104/m.229053 type:complete len:359 (+) Transcript_74104:140-1216(+)
MRLVNKKRSKQYPDKALCFTHSGTGAARKPCAAVWLHGASVERSTDTRLRVSAKGGVGLAPLNQTEAALDWPSRSEEAALGLPGSGEAALSWPGSASAGRRYLNTAKCAANTKSHMASTTAAHNPSTRPAITPPDVVLSRALYVTTDKATCHRAARCAMTTMKCLPTRWSLRGSSGKGRLLLMRSNAQVERVIKSHASKVGRQPHGQTAAKKPTHWMLSKTSRTMLSGLNSLRSICFSACRTSFLALPRFTAAALASSAVASAPGSASCDPTSLAPLPLPPPAVGPGFSAVAALPAGWLKGLPETRNLRHPTFPQWKAKMRPAVRTMNLATRDMQPQQHGASPLRCLRSQYRSERSPF